MVGFTSGYHAGAVLVKATPCVRIAQAAGARVRVSGLGTDHEEASVVYMQLDGEPWQQNIPSGEECIEVRCRLVASCRSCVTRCTRHCRQALMGHCRCVRAMLRSSSDEYSVFNVYGSAVQLEFTHAGQSNMLMAPGKGR